VAPDRDYLIVSSDTEFAGLTTQFRIDQMQKIQGFWIPTRSENTVLSKSARSTLGKDTYAISRVTVGGLTPAQWRKTLSFSTIIDGRTGRRYEVSGAGERVLASNPARSASSAGPLVGEWLYMTGVAFLLLLTLGVYRKWQHRRRANPA
jgi:hypothetical protein